MINEHEEWCPQGYLNGGWRGQKIAIAGHSHYADLDDANRDAGTIGCMERVVDTNWDTQWRIPFFTAIAGWFGNTPTEFWQNVMFFNFIPEIVGTSEEKNFDGSPEQIAAGKQRVLRILNEHKPEKLFVMSTKAWEMFPPTREDEAGIKSESWHHYDLLDGEVVKAIGLRHPQGANREEMTNRVRYLVDN